MPLFAYTQLCVRTCKTRLEPPSLPSTPILTHDERLDNRTVLVSSASVEFNYALLFDV